MNRDDFLKLSREDKVKFLSTATFGEMADIRFYDLGDITWAEIQAAHTSEK